MSRTVKFIPLIEATFKVDPACKKENTPNLSVMLRRDARPHTPITQSSSLTCSNFNGPTRGRSIFDDRKANTRGSIDYNCPTSKNRSGSLRAVHQTGLAHEDLDELIVAETN